MLLFPIADREKELDNSEKTTKFQLPTKGWVA